MLRRVTLIGSRCTLWTIHRWRSGSPNKTSFIQKRNYAFFSLFTASDLFGEDKASQKEFDRLRDTLINNDIVVNQQNQELCDKINSLEKEIQTMDVKLKHLDNNIRIMDEVIALMVTK
uniref:Uncharacterized protein n=1 Tax=viral metagenome TaxID=1070528 RepID=A0A6C0JWY1_9ZZZZ